MANPSIGCGAFIREVRRRHGLDQADLARRVGTAQPAISRLERDAVSPRLETLNRILEAMGETLAIQSVGLSAPAPGGSNQTIAELREDSRGLTPAQRLAQAAQLSEVSTQLALETEA
jgi:transcriptional regulator with XRE-family HTH domain